MPRSSSSYQQDGFCLPSLRNSWNEIFWNFWLSFRRFSDMLMSATEWRENPSSAVIKPDRLHPGLSVLFLWSYCEIKSCKNLGIIFHALDCFLVAQHQSDAIKSSHRHLELNHFIRLDSERFKDNFKILVTNFVQLAVLGKSPSHRRQSTNNGTNRKA